MTLRALEAARTASVPAALSTVLLAIGCGGGSTDVSSTGVGNPATVSLAVVTDDEPEPALEALDAGDDAAGEDPSGLGGEESDDCTSPLEGGADGALDGSADGACPSSEPDELEAGAVQHAAVVLGEVRWSPCDGALAPIVQAGPFVLDLVAHTVEPALPTVSVPAGGLCGLDAPLAPASRPAALAGKSVFFDGVRADGTPFLAYADMEGTLHMRPYRTPSWDASNASSMLWAFRPRRWLSRTELDRADAEPYDGRLRVIVVSVDRHPALFAALRARLAGRSTLYRDVHRDGNLDPDDRPLILGRGLFTTD